MANESFVNSNLLNGQILITEHGGLARQFVSNLGGDSVEGTTVHFDSTSNTIIKTEQNEPDCMGVIYNSGVPNGQKVWVVFSGCAKVLMVGAATAGHLARTFVTADGDFEAGKAKSEAIPASPFASDKHFAEIGHVFETTAGAGLALVNLHFN